MAFTVQDYHDFVRLLDEHLFGDDFETLPEIVRDILAIQRRTDQRLDSIAQRVEELAEAQRRTEERLDQLILRMEHVEQQIADLVSEQRRTNDRLNDFAGWRLGMETRQKAPALFGRYLRRTRSVELHTLAHRVEDQLTDDEYGDLLRADVFVRGIPKANPEIGKVWFVVEVSKTVDRSDVERAAQRSDILRRLGFMTIPLATGDESTKGARELAGEIPVVLMIPGLIDHWPKALATYTLRA